MPPWCSLSLTSSHSAACRRQRSASSRSAADVTDPAEIVGRGFFMRTPALVIDGTIVAAGRVPSRREVSAWLAPHHVPREVHP